MKRAMVVVMVWACVGVFGSALGAARAPGAYTVYRYIDKGGIRDPRTGQWLEAFRLLVPRGWTFKGGIKWLTREKPPAQLQKADLFAPARCGFVVSSPDGRYAFQAYPENIFVDLSRSPMAQMGMMPAVWSNYEGMVACPVIAPDKYVIGFVIPRMRGQLQNARLLSSKELPKLAATFENEAKITNQILRAYGIGNIVFKAALVSIQYDLNGMTYREDFLAVLQYINMQGTSLWWPRSTVSGRAPKAEFEAMSPCFLTMLASIRVNLKWYVMYKKMTDATWKGIQDVDAYCRKIDDEIVANRRKTNAQIHRDFYPLLAPFASKQAPDGQELFLPTGMNHYVNDKGEVVGGEKPPEQGDWKPMKVVAQE